MKTTLKLIALICILTLVAGLIVTSAFIASGIAALILPTAPLWFQATAAVVLFSLMAAVSNGGR